MGTQVPEVASLAHVSQIPIIRIDVTNGDAVDYTGAPVFADIPSSYIDSLGCDLSQMRLEDEDGNPVTFWPDANGAEVYPGYRSIWFKIDLPASGAVGLKLYCSPKAPTYTSNPTDVVDFYCDCSSLDQVAMYSQSATVDQNKYVDPPASIDVYPASTADKNSNGYVSIRFNYTQKLIVKQNLSFVAPGCGYDFYFIVNDGTSDYPAGPMVWYGGSDQVHYGTNIGYRTESGLTVLGQYDTDGIWHRYLVVVDSANTSFDLYYDGNLLGSSLPFYTNSPSWQSSYTYRYSFIAFSQSSEETDPNTSDPHIDAVVITSVPYSHLPDVTVALSAVSNASCLSEPPDLT